VIGIGSVRAIGIGSVRAIGIDPTERSSDAFQLIRREAGNRKSDRRTDNVT
jgi:hypothetical protein